MGFKTSCINRNLSLNFIFQELLKILVHICVRIRACQVLALAARGTRSTYESLLGEGSCSTRAGMTDRNMQARVMQCSEEHRAGGGENDGALLQTGGLPEEVTVNKASYSY